jgi:hypothetical protein
MTQDSQSFGVRLDGATLARLDAYAARTAHKRGWAAGRAIVAGLDALEGVAAPSQPASPASNAPDAPPVDVPALAGALYDLLGPQLADAAAEGARRARRPDMAPVGVIGVARVVDALRVAFDVAREGGELGDREARARLSGAVIEAINALAYGEGDDVPETPRPVAAPDAAPPLPAPSPRLPPKAVRGLQGERRRGPPERRDPPPREGEPGRRLPDAMKAAREARGLSQRSAADAAGVPLATFQRAEQGKDVRPETRDRLEAWIAAPART